MKGKTLCYRHDPEKREEALQASAKGGEASRGSRTMNIYLDGQITKRLSSRSVATMVVALLMRLEGKEGLSEEEDRLIRAELRAHNTLLTAFRQTHHEEGTMPPVRIELEKKASEAAAEIPTPVLEAMATAAKRQLH